MCKYTKYNDNDPRAHTPDWSKIQNSIQKAPDIVLDSIRRLSDELQNIDSGIMLTVGNQILLIPSTDSKRIIVADKRFEVERSDDGTIELKTTETRDVMYIDGKPKFIKIDGEWHELEPRNKKNDL